MLKLLTFSFTLFFIACSSIVNKENIQLPHNKVYAIGSFWNYTQTPMAGLKTASIVESVLSKENLTLVSLVEGNEEKSLRQSKIAFLKEQTEKAKQLKADYLITGEVQEWRYKSGIDAEPVVSYSIKIIELKSGNVLFNSVGAKSGWGNKSIGVVAQEIASELVPKFIN